MIETIRAAPVAAMAFVQLLRQSAHLDVHQALVAESLVYSALQTGSEFRDWIAAYERRPAAGSPPSEPAVLVHRFEGELTLVLNRPRKRNAFSVEMRDALAEGLMLAVTDESVERVVLSGAGPSFCSGGDLDEFGTFIDPAHAHAIRSARNASRLLASCADRVEARVHGACVGAGCELPAFAARVCCAPDAFFQLPELGMGLVPGAGGTASLPRRIGRQRTTWLGLSRARLDAETALAWGLVDAIEPR